MELHKGLSPVYYFSKIFGQSSYKLDKKTNTYRIDYIALVYNSLIAFGCFYLFVTTTFELNELEEDDGYTVSKASSLLDFYSGVINQTLAICFSCFYVRKLIRLLTDLEYIDKQITQLFGPIDRMHIFKKCCWALFVLMLEFNITFWSDFYFLMKSTDSKSYLFLSYIPVLATGTYKVQFYIYVQLITDRIKYLCNYLMEMEQKLNVSYAYNDRNKDLSKIFISNPNVNQFQFAIENIHKLHQKLCEAYESVNEMYGLQILLNVITVFSQNLTDLYYCYKVLTETFGKNFRNRPSCIADLFLTAQWCFVQLLEIVIMAYVCDKAHKQVFFI